MECPSHPAPGLAGSVLEEGFRVTDGSIRFLAGLSLAALAAITGIVSYLHALTVVYITGSAGLVAYLIPFVADLMIVTASLAILDAIRHHAPKPPLAMVSLVAGIGSTLAMNIVAGLHISAGGALVAALPPVAFVLSLETLMGIVRLARAGDSHLTASDGQCPHQVAMSAEEAVRTAYLHARDCLGEPVSQRQLSATFGVPRPKVATLVGTLNGTRPNDAEEDVTERVMLTHRQPTAAPQPPGPRGRRFGPSAPGGRSTWLADGGSSRDSAGPGWPFRRCPVQASEGPGSATNRPLGVISAFAACHVITEPGDAV